MKRICHQHLKIVNDINRLQHQYRWPSPFSTKEVKNNRVPNIWSFLMALFWSDFYFLINYLELREVNHVGIVWKCKKNKLKRYWRLLTDFGEIPRNIQNQKIYLLQSIGIWKLKYFNISLFAYHKHFKPWSSRSWLLKDGFSNEMTWANRTFR